MLARRAVTGLNSGALALLVLVTPQFLLYLNRMSIFPDQIWAMRRFLPVIIPVLLVGAAVTLAALWSKGVVGRGGAVVVAAAMVAMTLATTLPVARDRQWVGTLGEVNVACDSVGDDAAILLDDVGASSLFAETLRARCDVPVEVTDLSKIDLEQSARSGAESTGHRLFALAMSGPEGSDVPIPLRNTRCTARSGRHCGCTCASAHGTSDTACSAQLLAGRYCFRQDRLCPASVGCTLLREIVRQLGRGGAHSVTGVDRRPAPPRPTGGPPRRTWRSPGPRSAR